MKKSISIIFLLACLVTYAAQNNNLSVEALNSDIIQETVDIRANMLATRDTLSNELKALQDKITGSVALKEKLQKDSLVRWYKSDYEKMLKNYNEYEKNLLEQIKIREEKIQEIDILLPII